MKHAGYIFLLFSLIYFIAFQWLDSGVLSATLNKTALGINPPCDYLPNSDDNSKIDPCNFPPH